MINKMILLTLALALSGCGATYTRYDSGKTSTNHTQNADPDCPNGINYKTGRCR